MTTARFLGTLMLAVLCVWAGPAKAAERVALVIGNADYAHTASLPNPRNDAADVAAVLKRLGFEVTAADDLGFDGMRRVLRSFARDASGAQLALIFYAGHGMEVNKQNYLVPVDARLETDRDIEYEAVALDLLTNAVSGAKELGLVMLDACRNNPFMASMKTTSSSRSVGRGLARIEPGAGTLVSYAAKEGTIADDGDGRNSPYTKALLELLEEPRLEINFLFRKVRDSVVKATRGRQEPYTYGSLPGRQIFLVPEAPSVSVDPTAPAAPVDREALFWDSVKDSVEPAAIESYLERYPSGEFAKLARVRLERLRRIKRRREDVRLWEEVKDSGSADQLRQYLSKYPLGRYAKLARAKIEELKPKPVSSRFSLKSEARGRPGFTICNKSGDRVGIAFGYRAFDGQGKALYENGEPVWRSEGWWNLAAGKCTLILSGTLIARYYYIHAVSYDSQIRLNGNATLCVADKEFVIDGNTDCASRGFKKAGFTEIDTESAKAHTVTFTKTP